jgi:hypothetical protein
MRFRPALFFALALSLAAVLPAQDSNQGPSSDKAKKSYE